MSSELKTYRLTSNKLVYTPNIFKFCKENWAFPDQKEHVFNILKSYNLTKQCITDLMDGKVAVKYVADTVVFEYGEQAIIYGERGPMTQEEYENYQKKVQEFQEQEKIIGLSFEDEPYFSHMPCDCCKSPNGGNRYKSQAYHPESKEILEYQICQDCVYYLTHNQLDDETMESLTA